MKRSAQTALVTVKWLKDVVKNSPPNHRILDASWHLPNTGRNAAAEYKEKHIPGAQFFDIDGCSDKSTDLPHMIPAPEVFEDYVGSLGINNNTKVIIYDNNAQFPLFSAQRVWWTFRLFGHDQVSILEGGLPKWLGEGGAVSDKAVSVSKEHFQAKFNPKLVKKYDEVKELIQKPSFTLVDARPEGRFKGTAPEPRDDTKSGCIVGSCNIPFMLPLDLDKKEMKSPEQLQKIFQDAGVDLSKPLVATCGSGITACMLALAAYECGKDDVAVYDGSWTEWYRVAPAELKANVPD